jgi:hypothetical protein
MIVASQNILAINCIQNTHLLRQTIASGIIPPAEFTVRVDESSNEWTTASPRQCPHAKKVHRSTPVFGVEYIGYRSADHRCSNGRAQPRYKPRNQYGLNILAHRLWNKHHFPISIVSTTYLLAVIKNEMK